MNYVQDKVVIVTGAGNGFGRLVAEKCAAMGALLVCTDINAEALDTTVDIIRATGGKAQAVVGDVSKIEDMRAVAAYAAEKFGRIDVLVNNAGTMPLAFMADHASALDAWHKCIDINFKGVVNGTAAVYDKMLGQGAGQIVNVSSIYGNHPVVGGSVYGATKAAVNYFSNAVRQESRGKIRVSIIKPTGVPGTGLSDTIVNAQGFVGILGQNALEFQDYVEKQASGTLPPQALDAEEIQYAALEPKYIADAIVHVINQPLGVTLSEITVRASADPYIL
jgi:NADP-dependent 3-hydroxy acid dehydrogenase YdfG